MVTSIAYFDLKGLFFFFQAEDGIRDAQESRGLGDVYKRQSQLDAVNGHLAAQRPSGESTQVRSVVIFVWLVAGCLLYTSDAADDLLCVDLGGRRIIKKKHTKLHRYELT